MHPEPDAPQSATTTSHLLLSPGLGVFSMYCTGPQALSPLRLPSSCCSTCCQAGEGEQALGGFGTGVPSVGGCGTGAGGGAKEGKSPGWGLHPCHRCRQHGVGAEEGLHVSAPLGAAPRMLCPHLHRQSGRSPRGPGCNILQGLRSAAAAAGASCHSLC